MRTHGVQFSVWCGSTDSINSSAMQTLLSESSGDTADVTSTGSVAATMYSLSSSTISDSTSVCSRFCSFSYYRRRKKTGRDNNNNKTILNHSL